MWFLKDINILPGEPNPAIIGGVMVLAGAVMVAMSTNQG